MHAKSRAIASVCDVPAGHARFLARAQSGRVRTRAVMVRGARSRTRGDGSNRASSTLSEDVGVFAASQTIAEVLVAQFESVPGDARVRKGAEGAKGAAMGVRVDVLMREEAEDAALGRRECVVLGVCPGDAVRLAARGGVGVDDGAGGDDWEYAFLPIADRS